MQQLLRQLEKSGKDNSMFNISRECGEFLNNLIKQFKPKNILEVGTSNGYSTIWIASAAKEANVTTIEKDIRRIKLAKENFKKANLNNITIIHGKALESIPDQEFDFVFLDAEKKEYLQYVKLIKLAKGAIIAAHNVVSQKNKMKGYLEFIKNNYESRTYEDLDLEISYS
jgi:predicted O-methyltransferase YrrM